MHNITPRKPKRQFPCYVYLFVQHSNEPENRLVKIGIAKNPIRRLRQLQTGNPYAIFSHFVMKCHNESAARYIEHNLHELYASRRIPGSEWFRFSPTQRRERGRGNVPDDSAWINLEWMFAVAQTANPPNWDALGAREPYSAAREFDPMAAYIRSERTRPKPMRAPAPRAAAEAFAGVGESDEAAYLEERADEWASHWELD